jgi:hypothetical protein
MLLAARLKIGICSGKKQKVALFLLCNQTIAHTNIAGCVMVFYYMFRSVLQLEIHGQCRPNGFFTSGQKQSLQIVQKVKPMRGGRGALQVPV